MGSAPQTRYAKSGGISIAYQVAGDGPIDLVFVPGFVNNIDYMWELPAVARFYKRLMGFSRLILFDLRGQGASDPMPEAVTLEDCADDILAVMRGAGSERAVVVGYSGGGNLAQLFTASHPERVLSLVMLETTAKYRSDDGYPYGWSPEIQEAWLGPGGMIERWGEGTGTELLAPDFVGDDRFTENWGRFQRLTYSPKGAQRWMEIALGIDTRGILPTIQAPTLVLHRAESTMFTVGAAKDMAERIPGARFAVVPGNSHIPWIGEMDALVDEIENFVTGRAARRVSDRVLATVLFTDVVGSTERAAREGDQRWRQLLEEHHNLTRRELEKHRGREVKTMGDGFMATFDGPARAIRCADAIRRDVRELGIEVRAGLHTGECEVMDGDVGGIAVHIAARVAALAQPGEVMVTSTVKDLVAGSGIGFTDRGLHRLKGVEDRWRLLSVDAD